MDDPTTDDLLGVLRLIAGNIERLAIAVEEHNELNQKLNKCPRCQGDGKDYGGMRCVGCAGLGVKQPRADRRKSDVADSSLEPST
jgi:hypothetical protein